MEAFTATGEIAAVAIIKSAAITAVSAMPATKLLSRTIETPAVVLLVYHSS